MQRLLKWLLLACLMITLSYTAVGEVEKRPIGTDSSWKCLDTEVDNWNTVYYDDSWWESAKETSASPVIQEGMPIWYPGNPKPNKVYFRYNFDIDSNNIISGMTYVWVDRALNGDGYVKLYINGDYLGTITNTQDPSQSDIASLLHPGRNVIAAEVYTGHHAWALGGLLRYEHSEAFGSSPSN